MGNLVNAKTRNFSFVNISDLTEDMKDSNLLYWVGTMNAIKGQAEEIVYNEIVYK